MLHIICMNVPNAISIIGDFDSLHGRNRKWVKVIFHRFIHAEFPALKLYYMSLTVIIGIHFDL